jgi:hypothetical protein
MHLKNQLKIIQENNYIVPSSVDLDELINLMLENIGSLDSELRDEMIYTTFSNLIDNKAISNNQLRWLMERVMDEEHLFYKISEKDDQAVFTRTFSILVVALALYRHRQDKVFDDHDIQNIFDVVVRYAKLEWDLRGFVDPYGWAHSVAHTADALDELAMCSEINKEQLLSILELVKLKVANGTYVYTHEEDERLVTAVMNVMARQLLVEDALQEWLKSFNTVTPYEDYMKNYAMQVNIKNFLRSFYFRLLKSDEGGSIAETVMMILEGLKK